MHRAQVYLINASLLHASAYQLIDIDTVYLFLTCCAANRAPVLRAIRLTFFARLPRYIRSSHLTAAFDPLHRDDLVENTRRNFLSKVLLYEEMELP